MPFHNADHYCPDESSRRRGVVDVLGLVAAAHGTHSLGVSCARAFAATYGSNPQEGTRMWRLLCPTPTNRASENPRRSLLRAWIADGKLEC